MLIVMFSKHKFHELRVIGDINTNTVYSNTRFQAIVMGFGLYHAHALH